MYSPNPTPSSSSESSKSLLPSVPQLQTKCGFFFLHYLHVALQQCYTPAAIMFNYQNAKMYPFEILASKPDVFIFKGPSLLFSNKGPTLDQNTFEPISCSCRFLFLLTVIFSMSFSPSLHLTPDQSAQNVCPSSFLSIGSPSTAILQWNLH